MEREIRQPDYSDYTFVDNGRLLAISSRPEHAWLWTVQLWNVKGGGPVGAWRTLWEPDLHLAPYHAFHDFRVTFFRFAPITVRHLKTGEILATLPMRAGAYYAVALVECLLLIAWSVAWVRSGRRSRTPHPLLDAAFVHGVVTLVLAARLLTTASPHLVREMTGCLLCTELVAVSCLAAMWAAASDHRCMLRVSTALAAVTGATAAMVNPHFTLWRDHWDWDYVFASVALAICLACGVLGWRRLGVRVAPAPSVGRRDRGVRGSRVMLRDLFVFMAAIAACLAVVRFFKPSDYLRLWDGSMAGNPMFVASFYRWRLTKVSYLACEGVMFAIAAAAGAWFALAPSRWLLRAMVVILACLTTELPWWFFQKVLSLESWWQHLAAHSLVAVIVATILLVFRFHGYRIRMGAAEPCAERGAAS
jgi:hypothetical protein